MKNHYVNDASLSEGAAKAGLDGEKKPLTWELEQMGHGNYNGGCVMEGWSQSSLAIPATQEKPAAKFARSGPEALSDAELVSVALAVPLAKAESFVRDAATSPRYKAIVELSKRNSGRDPRPVVDSARTVAGLIAPEVRTARKEHFVILCLNARRQLVLQETVSIGTLSASLVHPRECFHPAIQASAAAVVCVHNHPSGDPTPSAEDRDVTRRLQRAGELLGIPLADHVIVSESGFFSFREHGIL